MSVDCSYNALISASTCYQCQISHGMIPAIHTYLLALIAHGSLDPSFLLQASACYKCIPFAAQEQIKTYLLCQIVEGQTGVVCDVNELISGSSSIYGFIPPGMVQSVQTYLLLQIAQLSIDSDTLISRACQFNCLDVSSLNQIQIFLLCQISGGFGADFIFSANNLLLWLDATFTQNALTLGGGSQGDGVPSPFTNNASVSAWFNELRTGDIYTCRVYIAGGSTESTYLSAGINTGFQISPTIAMGGADNCYVVSRVPAF